MDVVPPLDGSVPFRAQLTERWWVRTRLFQGRYQVPLMCGKIEAKGRELGFCIATRVFFKKNLSLLLEMAICFGEHFLKGLFFFVSGDSEFICEGFPSSFGWYVFLKILMEISGMKGVWAPIGASKLLMFGGPVS